MICEQPERENFVYIEKKVTMVHKWDIKRILEERRYKKCLKEDQ